MEPVPSVAERLPKDGYERCHSRCVASRARKGSSAGANARGSALSATRFRSPRMSWIPDGRERTGWVGQPSPPSPPRSVVQDDAQQRAVDLERELVVVLDEPELLELVQKEIHPGARRADHLSERLLRDLGNHADRLVLLSVARQQQERARQPLLARVEELIDQVFFDLDVARQHV